MQRIRDHVYEFDNLVIGGNLPALLYAYSKSLPILYIKRRLPLRFQETETPVFSGYQKVDLWNRLSALLSLSGLMPFSNKINSLRITGENSAEVFSDSRKFSISFNKLSIFDEEGIHGLEPPIFKAKKTYKVYDWLINRGMSKHNLTHIDSDDYFVKRVLFYQSERKGAQKITKDVIAISELSEEQFYDLNYSENYARLKAINMMKEAGLRGYSNGYSKIKKALQYYAIAIEHDRREYEVIGRDIYKNTKSIEHHVVSERDIDKTFLAPHLKIIAENL